MAARHRDGQRIVSFWHLADIPAALTNVRFRGKADMAERGVSQLVSVDLDVAVQFREVG